MARKAKSKKKLSEQEFFKLESGIQLTQDKAPNILKRGIHLKGKVKDLKSDGVIIAQGGDSQGFALIVHKNHLRYLTCVGGEITRTESKEVIGLSDFNFDVKMTPKGKVLLRVAGVCSESST